MKRSFASLILFMLILIPARTCFTQNKLHSIASMIGDSTDDVFSVVSQIGDVNGDGYADMLVGAYNGNYAKLFFGGKIFDTIPDMTFRCDQMNSRFGWAIAGGQDINGDGYPDFVIGAPYYWDGGRPLGVAESGKIYVYYGGPNLDTLANVEITMNQLYYNFGNSVALGDVNGDGYADIIVGAPNDDLDAHGRVYIYFGGKQLHTTPDIVLEGTAPYDNFGESVSYVGDVNGDGYGDFVVGAPQLHLTGPRFQGGKAYLFYGGLNVGFQNSILFLGDSVPPGQFGRVVAGLGDVNGDGIGDVGIMAGKYVNIISGKTLETILRVNADTLTYGLQTIAGIRDMNNDGINDFALGFQDKADQYSGKLNIYLGKTALDTLPDYQISGNSQNGYFACSIAGLGNINATASGEIAVGQNDSYGTTGPGRVYIYSFDLPDEVRKSNDSQIPAGYKLLQNFPNPFNPSAVSQK